jgi:SAM-dependent methyltransferase
MKLNLGCGSNYIPGWLNVDIRKDLKTDLRLDFNKKLPFKKNTFDEVKLKMALEHAQNPIGLLKEVIRVAKKGAILLITVPHARQLSAVGDIQHRTFFTEHSFDYNLLNEYGLNELCLFAQVYEYEHAWKRFIPFKRFFNVFLNGIYDNLSFIFLVNK